MRLAPSETRRMTLPDFLVIADAYAEAHAPPGRRRGAPVTADLAEKLKAMEGR